MNNHIKDAFENNVSAEEAQYWYNWTLGNNYSSLNQPQQQIEDLVCQDIQRRAQVGFKKYGRRLKDSKDNMLQHAYEEALDLACYLKKEIVDK